MTLTKLFTYYFDNWLRPLVFFFIIVGLFIASELLIDNPSIQDIFLLILGIGLLNLFVSTIYQLIKKRWTKAVVTMLLCLSVIVGFFVYTAWLFKDYPSLSKEDLEKLKPTFTEIHLPLDSLNLNTNTKPDFELYNSSKHGLYKYELWLNRIDKGNVYLRAFETTTYAPVVVNELREKSTIQVENLTDKISLFHMDKDITPFSIDTGEWTEPHTIRIEVWYKNNLSGQEKKLLEKLYKVQPLTK